jgi:hypothetical protein
VRRGAEKAYCGGNPAPALNLLFLSYFYRHPFLALDIMTTASGKGCRMAVVQARPKPVNTVFAETGEQMELRTAPAKNKKARPH